MGARLDAALGYASQGRSVIPVAPGGKIPAIEWRRYQAERATQSRIRHWWNRDDFNVGIVTGAISDLLVVDVDGRSGGYESLARLLVEHGHTLDDLIAPEVATAGGGVHLWFRHPGVEVRNSAGVLGPGLDVRGDGGFVVAPPSTRADGAYAWCEWLCEVPPLPGWLLDLLAPARPTPPPPRTLPFSSRPAGPKYVTRALEGERAQLLALPEGRRHSELVKSATRIGTLLHLVDDAEADAIRGALIRTGQDMGLPEKEARQIVDDQFDYGRKHPRSPR